MNIKDQVKIISLGIAVPEESYSQEETFLRLGYPREFKRIFTDAGIETRHFWVPLGTKLSWQEACEEYPKAVLKLGTEAVRNCISDEELSKVGYFIFQSCTGFTVPSMNYQIAKEMGMSPTVEFVSNIGDGGCVGALPSLRQAWKHTQLTRENSLAVSCEISSLCYYPDEDPFPDPRGKYQLLRANALFGDGASAALFGYDDNPKHPYIVDYQSFTDYSKQYALGMEWLHGRLACVLSHEVPKLAPAIVSQCLKPLMFRNMITISDIKWLMIHPGGKAVLDNVQNALGLPEIVMGPSREALRIYGNCSSTSVGLLSKNFMENRSEEVRPGDWGLVVTVGSGMSSSAMLIRWPE